MPIFKGGQNIQNLKAADAAKRAAVAKYESAIQTAFKEVSDALATEGTIQDQLKATTELAEATHKTYELSLERYKNGVDSFLQVLDSQRSDFSAQQALVNMKLSRATSVISLYKVMGGGSQLAPEKGEGEQAKESEK